MIYTKAMKKQKTCIYVQVYFLQLCYEQSFVWDLEVPCRHNKYKIINIRKKWWKILELKIKYCEFKGRNHLWTSGREAVWVRQCSLGGDIKASKDGRV